MESRIERLLESYWEGKTSLNEEYELKTYFRENPSNSEGARFFAAIHDRQKITPVKSFYHPGRRLNRNRWSVAAVITLGIVVAFFSIKDTHDDDFLIEDPAEAYEITKKALMMVSSKLNEGSVYGRELNKINEVQLIIKEKKNEKDIIK
ncbi:MAG: hypothetical protein O2887_04125 [Bacteroidetes bacterium]|nr:hypothetical protein [Bacteroidota bacterium]MDA1119673.1 hypothetical protein [Bacteroidota bacterium]